MDKGIWKDFSKSWPQEGFGPDPRIRKYDFSVRYQTKHTDPSNDGLINEGEREKHFKTFEQAVKHYEKMVSDPSIVECDIRMTIEFGGYYRTMQKVFTPSFNHTYIYLVRWRKDGAFLESYHFNESKFAERAPMDGKHENTVLTKTPGLMSYWIEQSAKESETKKQKN